MALKLMGTLAVFALTMSPAARAADKDKIVWKPIPNAILQVDSRALKEWNLFQAGKKTDPLLAQLGGRFLVIYVSKMEVYELKPEQLEHKGEDILWRESDRPAKPTAISDWNTKDVGSAFRILFTLADEGRMINIQTPKMPDVRRGIY